MTQLAHVMPAEGTDRQPLAGVRLVEPFPSSYMSAAKQYHSDTSGISTQGIPVVFRTDPIRSDFVVAVFVIGLAPTDGCYMAHTMEGAAEVSEAWIAASGPARPFQAKALAAKMRRELGANISTRLEMGEEARACAERRRRWHFNPGCDGSREAYRDIGRADAFAASTCDPEAVAALLAHNLYRTEAGYIAHAYGTDWDGAVAKLAQAGARLQSDPIFAADYAMAEGLARANLAQRSTIAEPLSPLAA